MCELQIISAFICQAKHNMNSEHTTQLAQTASGLLFHSLLLYDIFDSLTFSYSHKHTHQHTIAFTTHFSLSWLYAFCCRVHSFGRHNVAQLSTCHCKRIALGASAKKTERYEYQHTYIHIHIVIIITFFSLLLSLLLTYTRYKCVKTLSVNWIYGFWKQ